MELGAQFSFRSDPAWNYRGAYLEVDERMFFYSAAIVWNSIGSSRVHLWRWLFRDGRKL